MAPKRKERESLESLLARPWCYYCDRDFDDLKILHDHQKAKHFHCIVGTCNRRLNTAGGLRVHMEQVHKEDLKVVPNALPDRMSLTPEVFGMEGVPQFMLDQRTSMVIKEYNKLESDWRAKTGNPLSGTQAAKEESEQSNKRQKVAVDKEALKRLAAKAKAARQAKNLLEAPPDRPDWDEPEPFMAGSEPSSSPEPEPEPEPVMATPPPPAPSTSPYGAPQQHAPAMPMNGAPALPSSFAGQVSMPYMMPGMPSSASPPYMPGLFPPPGTYPLCAGWGFSGLPARVNMPLPGMSSLPSIPGLPPRPVPSAYSGSLENHLIPASGAGPSNGAPATSLTSADVEAFINSEHQKYLAFHADDPKLKNARPLVEAGAQLIYSDNFITPEEKKAFNPRYRPGAKSSTVQTMGHTQAATGPVAVSAN